MTTSNPFKQDRGSDKAKSFAAGFGATDLTAIAGKFPNSGPQFSEAHNANVAASQNCVVTLEDGSTFTLVLAPNETRPIRTPISALQVSGADISVACYWWCGPSATNEYNYQVAYNT